MVHSSPKTRHKGLKPARHREPALPQARRAGLSAIAPAQAGRAANLAIETFSISGIYVQKWPKSLVKNFQRSCFIRMLHLYYYLLISVIIFTFLHFIEFVAHRMQIAA